MSTLLVVDDEPRVVTLLTRFLVAEGHSVITAPDGLAALELLRDKQVDLILLDLVMPRCNGLQLLGRMVETLQDQPPVIVLSCVNEVAARVQALDRGAVDFVQKPFHTSELMARVRRHLRALPSPREHGDDRFLTAGGIRL